MVNLKEERHWFIVRDLSIIAAGFAHQDHTSPEGAAKKAVETYKKLAMETDALQESFVRGVEAESCSRETTNAS